MIAVKHQSILKQAALKAFFYLKFSQIHWRFNILKLWRWWVLLQSHLFKNT